MVVVGLERIRVDHGRDRRLVEKQVMPYIEKIRFNGPVSEQNLYTAYVTVERHETISHGDVFPYFEGRRYRALGAMQLIDGENWMPNHRGVDVRIVAVGVVEVEPDGTSFVRMRLSKSMLEPKKKRRKR